jgi:hypothetical protein
MPLSLLLTFPLKMAADSLRGRGEVCVPGVEGGRRIEFPGALAA